MRAICLGATRVALPQAGGRGREVSLAPAVCIGAGGSPGRMSQEAGDHPAGRAVVVVGTHSTPWRSSASCAPPYLLLVRSLRARHAEGLEDRTPARRDKSCLSSRSKSWSYRLGELAVSFVDRQRHLVW